MIYTMADAWNGSMDQACIDTMVSLDYKSRSLIHMTLTVAVIVYLLLLVGKNDPDFIYSVTSTVNLCPILVDLGSCFISSPFSDPTV